MTTDQLFNSFCLEGKITEKHAQEIKNQLREWEKERNEYAVKITISHFCIMNIENPSNPVNIDEVKRRALKQLLK